MGRIFAGVLLFGVVVICSLGAGRGQADTEPPAASGPAPGPVHHDPKEVLDGAVEAVRAYLQEDSRAMRAALDRVDRATRRLDREQDAALGSSLITYEQAFHETLDRAREWAIRGNLEEAFNQFVWTQRACVTCHGIARDQGLITHDRPSPEE